MSDKNLNRDPLVSIIMPVYNEKKCIRQSMESILNQTLQDFEFIIINELGSVDGSAEVIQEYAEKDIRIYFLQKTGNKGIGYSLNIGLEIAKGRYIARMDADDYSLPERLQRQVEYMEKNTEVDILGTNFIIKTAYGEKGSDFPCESRELKAEMPFRCALGHPTVMFRGESVRRLGIRYNPEYLAEDYELWIRMFKKAVFANLKEQLVIYSAGNPESLSTRNYESMVKETAGLSNRLMEELLGMKLLEYNEFRLYAAEGFRGKLLGKHAGLMGHICEEFAGLEEQNEIKEVFDRKSFSHTLKNKWNVILEQLFERRIGGKLYLKEPATQTAFQQEVQDLLKKEGYDCKNKQDLGLAVENMVNSEINRIIGAMPEKARLVIFGAGKTGARLYEELGSRLESGFELLGYADNDERKQGGMLNGYRIYSAAELNEMCVQAVVITACHMYDSIYSQLKNEWRDFKKAAILSVKDLQLILERYVEEEGKFS